jgi:hypothetical protein
MNLKDYVQELFWPVQRIESFGIGALVVTAILRGQVVKISSRTKAIFSLGQTMFLVTLALAVYARYEIYIHIVDDPGMQVARRVIAIAQGTSVVGVALIVVGLIAAVWFRYKQSPSQHRQVP